jgi:hypothetical protein
MHDVLGDKSIGRNTIYGDDEARRLASRDPEKARRNPENYEQFLLQVWADEGIEAPSGAEKIDDPIRLRASNDPQEVGFVKDRPAISRSELVGRADLMTVALHGRDSDTCRLIDFEQDGNRIARRESSNMAASMDGSPGFCQVGHYLFVAAMRESGSQRLKLIAWQRGASGTYEQLGDSGTLFGDIRETPVVIWLGGGGLAVLFKGVSTGRMKVVMAHVDRRGVFTRRAEAETSGAIHSAPSGCLIAPYVSSFDHPYLIDRDRFEIVTAFRTREGRLSVDCWEIDRSDKVTRRSGLVDRSIEGRPAITCLPAQQRAIVATHDKDTGRMRLTGFEARDPRRLRRVFDSGGVGVKIASSPDIVAVGDPAGSEFATAMRMRDGGRLRVQRWGIRDGSTLALFRLADSGGETGPVIDGSPSIARARPGGSTRFHTAATRGERLRLCHWI